MKTIGSNTGFSGLALIALIVGAAACGGTTTVYKTGPAGPTDTPEEGTPPEEKPVPDPSTQGDPTDKATPAPPLVKGLAITEVAFFQAVKVPVITAGKPVAKTTRNAPVVANRPALVRVYVAPGAGYTPGEVTAELRLFNGATRLPAIKDTQTMTGESTDEDRTSTFNFEVPAESLPPGVTYQVFLTAKGGEVPGGAVDTRIPKDGGVQDLQVETSGKLKVVIVPVQYNADGSGRTPDVSATQLALYKATFMARYAATEVEVTARAPWSYASAISANGSGFSAILNAITNLRKADGVAADVYYYGAFAPKSSFGSYCGGGCVTGLSTVVQSAKTSFLRASVGVGYPGEETANTAAHEVGHAHGREHAPCGGADGADPNFPYPTGGIGVWGYNIIDKTFLSPTKGKDMMGYCPNEWVSDYTYTALFDRIAQVNGGVASAAGAGGSDPGTFQAAPAARTTQTFRMAMLEGDGSVTWGGDVELDEEPTSVQTRTATFVSAAGQTIATHTAHFYPYDHLPGGVLVMPATPTAATVQLQNAWSQVRISGAANALVR
jgi:Peptidase M66